MSLRTIAYGLIMAVVLSSCGGKTHPVVKQIRSGIKPSIALQPFERVAESDLRIVGDSIESYYPFQTFVLPVQPNPKEAWYSPRQRYRAEKMLRYLESHRPENAFRILGVMASDISTTKGKYEDFGIMGLGSIGGGQCVVSTFRVKKYSTNNASYRLRLCKLARHELGHTLGLDHCIDETCVMADLKGSGKHLDMQKSVLCDRCLDILGKIYLRD